MSNFAKTIKHAVLICAGLVAGQAAFADPTPNVVTINENSVPGMVIPNLPTVNVTQLSGLYDEVITFGAGNTFVTEAYFHATGWDAASLLNASPFVGGYAIYAKFSASGTYVTTGSGTLADPFVTTFSAPTNYIELWLDPNQDTSYGIGTSATGSVANLISTGNTSDDKLLGTASMTLASEGNTTFPATANGNFEIIFGDFTLSVPAGDNYFVAPRPFYLGFDLNGNFQSLVPVSGSSIQVKQNSANGFFFQTVPEPASLALVGVALLGAAGVARRREKKAN
jgi:hypothetical protein